MTEIIAYRIVIAVLATMVAAWVWVAQRQSNAMLAALSQAMLGKTAVDWLRTHPRALALLAEHRETLVARAEKLSAEAYAAAKSGRIDAPANLRLLALTTRLEAEDVRYLIRAATR